MIFVSLLSTPKCTIAKSAFCFTDPIPLIVKTFDLDILLLDKFLSDKTSYVSWFLISGFDLLSFVSLVQENSNVAIIVMIKYFFFNGIFSQYGYHLRILWFDPFIQ